MSEQSKINKSQSSKPHTEASEESTACEQGTELKAELDDLLDEIDEVLEANAEDFVKSYIQKGGQ